MYLPPLLLFVTLSRVTCGFPSSVCLACRVVASSPSSPFASDDTSLIPPPLCAVFVSLPHAARAIARSFRALHARLLDPSARCTRGSSSLAGIGYSPCSLHVCACGRSSPCVLCPPLTCRLGVCLYFRPVCRHRLPARSSLSLSQCLYIYCVYMGLIKLQMQLSVFSIMYYLLWCLWCVPITLLGLGVCPSL